MKLDQIFSVSLIYATFRSATPIIYAALCAAITQQADILNIGTEGIMLTGAFTAVAVSYMSGSWLMGILVAMAAGFVMAGIMALAISDIRQRFVRLVWELIYLRWQSQSLCLT